MKTINNPYNSEKILLHIDKLKSLLCDKSIPFPINLEVDLVDGACNSKCKFCCFGNNNGGKVIYLKKEPLLKNLRLLKDYDVKTINLVGGSEPTMHSQISEIIEEIAQIGFQTGLITNGILLKRVLPVVDNLSYIRVSFDAGTSEMYKKLHGVDSFSQVVDNIKRISEKHCGTKIGLGYVCLPENTNINELTTFCQLAKSLKVNYVVFRPAVLDKNQSADYLNNFQFLVKDLQDCLGDSVKLYLPSESRWVVAKNKKRTFKGKCIPRPLKAVIMADGSIPFCHLRRRDTNLYLGNIYKNSFIDIWHSERHKSLSEIVDIQSCRLPCSVHDYHFVMDKYKNEILEQKKYDNFITDESDPYFI